MSYLEFHAGHCLGAGTKEMDYKRCEKVQNGVKRHKDRDIEFGM